MKPAGRLGAAKAKAGVHGQSKTGIMHRNANTILLEGQAWEAMTRQTRAASMLKRR